MEDPRPRHHHQRVKPLHHKLNQIRELIFNNFHLFINLSKCSCEAERQAVNNAQSKLNGLKSDLKTKQDERKTALDAVTDYQSFADLPGTTDSQREYYLRAVENYTQVAEGLAIIITNLEAQIVDAQKALDDANQKLADCLAKNSS